MAHKKKKTTKFTKKLLNKYRLVILNEDTFEERVSLKLTRLNVFVLLSLSTIFLVVATTILIAFTPLREYIPGYSSVALKKRATALYYKTDSLQRVIAINDQYFQSIKKVLHGEVDTLAFNKDSIIKAREQEAKTFDLSPSKEDSLLREKVRKEDKYNLFESAKINSNFILFPPVSGTISQEFKIDEKHFGVDIVAVVGTPVKATADGVIIFSDWTTDGGYVIILKHSQGLISVYKHNAMLTKSQGDSVTAGEVIATIGNTGEISTGPHLHFELWSNGYPINPTNFIDFK
ncbi:M23 family metallopeptidase [Bizionia sediminis]|uniref:M23 family metallopeptidase n=1 Tax=Bizionia sediminis TaxID=1737064 RepID=A0ABW5KR89_9FLAO